MFLSTLIVEAIPPNLWQLYAPLIWEDAEFGRFEVPTGTITDLASIPRILRRHRSFDPQGPSRRPAVGHDLAYATGKLGGRELTRAEADRFLYVALLSEGVSRALAWSFYAGVRVGGWVPWNRYRAAEVVRST